MSLTAINKVKALKREKAKRKARKKKRLDLSSYKNKPLDFFQEILNIDYLTEEQKKIIENVINEKTTNVQAGHGLGKSYVSAGILIFWLFCINGTVISTAPTFNQVNDILWKEVRKLYDANRKKLGGRRNQLSIITKDLKGNQIRAFGKSSSDVNSNAFQGQHDEYLLMIQDEADGISDTIDEAFEACLTGSKNRGLRIGNPLTNNSAFAKNCAISSIKIPVWSHINVSWGYSEVIADNGRSIHRLKPEIARRILKPEDVRKDDPVLPQSEWDEDLPRDVIPGAVSIAWIEKVRAKYGEFSAYWMSRVEAEFPTDSIDGIIPKTWLTEARSRYDKDPEYWDRLALADKWRIGVDVGDGGDRHAISLWRGKVLYAVKLYQTRGDREDVLRLATEIVEPQVKNLGGMYQIAVDRIGVGAGTLAKLKQDGYMAIDCNFGGSAEDKTQYKNRKSELYWQLREGLRLGEIAIAPLGDVEAEVFEELSAIRYNTNTEKQILCEPKDKTRARLKRSPDGADAIVIALEISTASISYEPTETSIYYDSEEKAIAQAIERSRNRLYDEKISSAELDKYWNL